MTKLDSLVKEYYGQQSLSEQQLDRIQAAADNTGTPERVWYMRLGAIAAALIVGFSAMHFHLSARSTTELVLSEIAMNHKKQLAVDVATSNYADLLSAMDRLDFTITPPPALAARFELLGGRYCSIQGALAAQIKVRDRESGAIRTLYATPMTTALEGINTRDAVHDGVHIELWDEAGVFYGLADDNPS